jgi:ketosteroid isomerase-like protein
MNFIQIQDLLENYKSAIYEKDVERFVSVYGAHIHVYDCWDNWECKGIPAWKENAKVWFDGLNEEGVSLKVDFADLEIQEGSDLALVHGGVTFAAYNQSREKLRQITNRFTFGLRKEQGSWIIIHEHSSLPISMENGKGLFDLC